MTIQCRNPTCSRKAPNAQAARNVGWAWSTRDGRETYWVCPRCKPEMVDVDES